MDRYSEKWEILPSNKTFDLKLKSVWAYRDLLWLMVRRDFVSFYKQTIFGPLWFFIQPVFTTIMFTFIFGKLARIPVDNLPQPLFYLAGITTWNYFADCFTKTSSVFKDNAPIFGKVYFPRLIVPLSIVVSSLTRFGVQMILFLGVMAYYYFAKDADFHPTWAILLFPVIVILMGLLGLGAGMIISAMTTKYRDLSFLVGFGVQLLMYATTVIIPLSEAIKNPKIGWIIAYNPMTPIIETFRYGFLGRGTFDLQTLGLTIIETLIIFFVGIIVFNKVEKNFVDTV
jgi:lipopolysaccharide transport system permease protein